MLSILDNEKFVKNTDNPTKHIECKIQQCGRKINKNLQNRISTAVSYWVFALKTQQDLC